MRLLILLAGIVIVMLTARLANADDWVSGRQWGNAFTESPRPSIRERPQPEQKNATTKASDFMFQELTPLTPLTRVDPIDLCRRYGVAAGGVSYHKVIALPTNPPTECPGVRVIPKMPDVISHVEQNLK